MPSPIRKVLFLSNGHGEDLNASEVLKALKQKYPTVEVAAMPIVGEGNAYRRLGIPIIGPTKSLPSGGFVYMSRWKLATDIRAGLIGLIWQQIQSVRTYSHDLDLVFAAGDIVALLMARLTGKPYAAFIVSSSGYYENRMQLPFTMNYLLRSPLCQVIFTRDALTARQLNAQGIAKTVFAGYPIMDVLEPTQRDLALIENAPTIALLPGSRLPEACHNLALMLELAAAIARDFAPMPVQFRAALVPSMMAPVSPSGTNGYSPLSEVATQCGWQERGNGQLYHPSSGAAVGCYGDAFADILHQCNLAIGMAGTAVEQAVGLGKPVIQIPGRGPQFTYRFAEAQMRLLGQSVQTIGTKAADSETIAEVARQVRRTLENDAYLQACVQNGLERVGNAGGSVNIADRLASYLFGKQPDQS